MGFWGCFSPKNLKTSPPESLNPQSDQESGAWRQLWLTALQTLQLSAQASNFFFSRRACRCFLFGALTLLFGALTLLLSQFASGGDRVSFSVAPA